MAKFIPQVKEKPKKVKIKPPVKKQAKFKVTNQIYRQIEDAAKKLPETPFFIKGADGKYIVQRTKFSRLLSTEEAEEQNQKNPQSKEDAEKNRIWVQKGTEIRKVNHKVNLIAAYEMAGTRGIQSYIDEINFIQSIVNKKQEVKNEESNTL